MSFIASRLAAQASARSAPLRRSYATESFKLPENEFNNTRASVKSHAAGSTGLWRKISIYAVIPAIAVASVNAYNLWNEHWEHQSHLPPVEERPEYPYQNIRTKNYFWGDGDKTFFWNDNVNYHKK